jgi:6-phosphogluconate dehydrogenase (decarboxylating)
MRQLFIAGSMAVLVSMLVGTPRVAAADTDKVLQVVAVQVKSGMVDKYVSRVDKLKAVQERLGTKGTIRVWQASIAGDNTGTVVVGVEYPSLAAFADGMEKLNADSEWQGIIAGLDDIRTIVSTSLYRELTP